MPGAYLTKWTNSHPLSANLPFDHHLLQFRKPGLIQQKKMVCTTCQTTLYSAKTEMAMAEEWPCTSLIQPPTSRVCLDSSRFISGKDCCSQHLSTSQSRRTPVQRGSGDLHKSCKEKTMDTFSSLGTSTQPILPGYQPIKLTQWANHSTVSYQF